MNLAIDIGNSYCKLGVFDKDNKIDVLTKEKPVAPLIEEVLTRYEIRSLIYSSVVKSEKVTLEDTGNREGIKIYSLTSECRLPFKIAYRSPATLGTDRLAAVAGADNKFHGRNVLIIDAGTAVTYDILTSGSVYSGGNISPGIQMRFKALNTFTSRLPLVEPNWDYPFVADTTTEAISSGVLQGLVFEINEYIRNFIGLYNDPEIIITGGDGQMLSGKTIYKPVWFPDLVIEGLNYILNYNAKVY